MSVTVLFTEQDILHLVVSGDPTTLLAALKRTPGLDMGCRPRVTTLPDGRATAAIFVPATSLPALQATGLIVELRRNASADGRLRQAEVLHHLPPGVERLQGLATHTRPQAGPNATPDLISGYLSTPLVEATLGSLAAQYPSLCQRITLPHVTVDGNTVTMLRVGAPATPKARGVLLTACAHAREWGGAEICLNFLMDLLAAYTTGAPIIYGNSAFTPAQVTAILTTVDLFVVPCINPDGRAYSQTTEALWRKNRNGPGVDLNRNYDFLWNFPVEFNPSVAAGTDPEVLFPPASTDPANDLYHGTAPVSEAECRNVVWVLDNFPSITFMLDIHSFTGDVLYSWGDSPNQVTYPKMNFLNAAWNGTRGVPEVDTYGEYLPQQDLLAIQGVAGDTVAAIIAVRGQAYQAHQDYDLKVAQNNSLGYYPTSGAVDDYAYSRHFSSPTATRVYAFTLEFGLPAEFAPAFPEMANIIADIDAGLLAFCLSKVNPCAALELELSNLRDQIETIQEALADGEIPEPRTPANIAGVRREIQSLTQQARLLSQQLARCQAGATAVHPLVTLETAVLSTP